MVTLVAVLAAGAGIPMSAGAGGTASRHHVVIDGVPLDEVHPRALRPGASGRRPGVVVAHGFAGSARLMTPFADTLAARGYVVVLLDFGGHGTATRPMDGDAGLQRDLDTATRHLRGLPDVDPSRVAVVGHSMGAGAAVRYGATHPDVGATVALSLPDASDVRPNRPRRLLVLVGGLEFAGFRDAARRAAETGGGREVVVPAVEHVTILYAPRAHREVVGWLDGAFGDTAGRLPSPVRRPAGAALLMLAFVLGFVPLIRAVLGPARPRPWPTVPAIGLAMAVSGGVAVVAALVAAVVPTTRLPIAIGGYLVGFTALTGVGLVVGHRLSGHGPSGHRREAPSVGSPAEVRSARRLGVAAPLLVAYAGAAIAVPLHLGVAQAVPVGPRWWLLLLIWAGFAVLAFGAELLTARSGVGLLAVSAVATIVLTAAAVAGLTSGFVLLVVPLLAALMAWQALWSGMLYAHDAPAWLVAPVGALVVAWPVAVTLPLTA